MQQQNNLQPGSKLTTEYQLTDTISLVTFLDDSCTARYILVDKTKQNGRQTCARFTDNCPFTIKGLLGSFFIQIGTGKLFFCGQPGGKYCQIGPKPINKTLTYVDENDLIHCLDLTQDCNSLIANYNLKKFFTTKLSPCIYEAEKYKILSALIALDRYGMEQKLNLNVHYFISSYKDFLKYMIKLNHGLWRKLLLICSQFGSYNKNAKEEIIDVIREEKEKLNNNQIYYGNNRNYNPYSNNNRITYTNNNQFNNMNYNNFNYNNQNKNNNNLYNNNRNYKFNNSNNQNDFYNNMMNKNNPQEELLGTFESYDCAFCIYGKKLPNNQISYTRISPKNGSGSVNLLNTNNWFFNCDGCTLYFDKSGPQPNLQIHVGENTWLPLTWYPAQQQTNNINNFYYNQNNNNNYQQNFGNNNIKYFKNSYYIPLLNQQVVVECKYDTIRKQLVFLSINGTSHDYQHINNGGVLIAYYNGVCCRILFNRGCIKILGYYDNIPLATIDASTGGITVNNQNPQLNNNYNFYNNNQNINNNYVIQPTKAAAVEQGQVGVYDEDTTLLMDVLKNGGKLKDNGFVINPEDGGEQSISKNGKVLFIGKIKGNQLIEGQLNVKFKDGKATEYYVGKFKNNLFEDTQGIYVFEERYGTGRQERFEGSFSQGKPHGQVTFYDAHELPSEYEYDHGKIISIEGFRDIHDTDVIVFDAAISFEDAYTDRYANNFHIVAQEVYDKKKEDIFGKGDEAVKMPTANDNPNEEQKAMMEFIQKYILVKEPNGDYQSDYIAKFCYDNCLIEVLNDVLNDVLNEYSSFIDSSEKMKYFVKDFVAKMKKDFFGDDQRPISELIGKNNELREKWLCFVVDKIGMRAFNEMYAMKNLEHFVNKIQNNGNKKLKVVFSNHGSSSLHLFQDNEVFSAKWMDKLMAAIKGLKRDTYVVNQSCYGGEKLDKKSFSKRIFNAEDLRIDNYKTNKIVSNELMEKLQKIKEKYKDNLGKFKQLMSYKESISFASNCTYQYNGETINYKLDSNLKKFMYTLFGIQGQQKGNLKFNFNNGQRANIVTQYSQKDIPLLNGTEIFANQKQELLGGVFLTSSEIQLNNEIFNQEHISDLFDYTVEFPRFYAFLDGKIKQSEKNNTPCNLTAAEAEQEFVKQRLEQKCKEIGIDYQQFEKFEKDFEELKEENNKTCFEWKNKFNNKIDESISEFLDKNKLLDPMDKLKMDFEKKMIELEDELEDNDEIPSDEQIKKITNDICEQLKTVGENISKNINNVLQEINNTPNYNTFIQENFGSLYDFCANNKDILFKNIFEKDGLLSKVNLITILTASQERLNMNIKTEIERISKELPENINNKRTLKNKLQLLKQKGFGNKIVYSKNLSSKMVHYTERKYGNSNQAVSNSERHMMYYIIDNNGKMKPLVKDVDDFKKSLEEFEAELEKQSKIKREGQNFGEAFHDSSTISNVFNKSGLKEYIKEAKANKNIILGYNQPNGLEGFEQTVDENGNAIINNTKTNINLSVGKDSQFATVKQIKEEIPNNTYYNIEHKETKDNLKNVNNNPEDTKEPEDSFRNIANVNKEPKDTKEPQDNTQHKYVKDSINKEQLTNNNNYNTNKNLSNSNNNIPIYNSYTNRNTNIISTTPN